MIASGMRALARETGQDRRRAAESGLSATLGRIGDSTVTARPCILAETGTSAILTAEPQFTAMRLINQAERYLMYVRYARAPGTARLSFKLGLAVPDQIHRW